jgi:uncharacterized RDD family membrane protein YckC
LSTSSSNLELNFRPDGTLETIPRWKQELNERLAATRSRRSREIEEHASLPSLDRFSAKQESRASRLAARVAERYANAPSYSEILAAEARAAANAADAAVVAAEEARDRAQALLAGIETQPETHGTSFAPVFSSERDVIAAPAPESIADEFVLGLDEEALIAPAQPLPVNLIEFPRELVAARRARPRLEEGPLRESFDDAAEAEPPLRIFEAEPGSVSHSHSAASSAAEWSSIRLDAKPHSASAAEAPLEVPLQAASLEDRLMAGIFDAALVLLAFVLFILVFAACTAHPPAGKPALFCAGLVLGGLFLLYQYLFFKFGEGTPGMRYAKIALCTFEDENPTRSAMRRRILFLLLSAAPLGLGLAWAFFDEDRLAWHDRLTRMYQRSYR